MYLLVLALLLALPSFDARLTGYEYPFPVKQFALESQGQKLEMAYMDVAPERPNGRTVVLMHGKNFSGAYWAPTVKALTALGYRVVVPDQLGFGKSSKPEHFQYTFQELATDTRRLLDSLQVEKVTVVGHSIGGMLATRFTLMFPDRVEKLALVDPIGLEDWRRTIPYLTVDENLAKELKSTPESVKKYMQDAYFGGQWKPEYDSLLTIPTGWMNGPDYPLVARNAALTSDMLYTQPVVYEFPLLKCPTLILVGAKDRTAPGKERAPEAVRATLGDYPKLARAAHSAIPGSTLVILENSGHLPQLDDWSGYWQALSSFVGR